MGKKAEPARSPIMVCPTGVLANRSNEGIIIDRTRCESVSINTPSIPLSSHDRYRFGESVVARFTTPMAVRFSTSSASSRGSYSSRPIAAAR